MRLHQGLNKREALDKAIEALRLVGIPVPERRVHEYPHQLSGGQRQRLMLARVYLMRPRLIIADEPVSMIDAGMRASFLNILLDFRETHGISTLFITHDLSTAMYLGGEIIVLYQGRIMERGQTRGVMKDPQHPYAQLLISSIPTPDPRKRWEEDLSAGPLAEVGSGISSGRDRCLFAERCPAVMDRCWGARPHLQAANSDGMSEPDRDVACYLYQ